MNHHMWPRNLANVNCVAVRRGRTMCLWGWKAFRGSPVCRLPESGRHISHPVLVLKCAGGSNAVPIGCLMNPSGLAWKPAWLALWLTGSLLPSQLAQSREQGTGAGTGAECAANRSPCCTQPELSSAPLVSGQFAVTQGPV